MSADHIFAAQSEKAVVHVYNREKGNQEAIVPFPVRIHSITLAAQETVLVLGTEDGSVLLWETCTGRQIATPQSHLKPVTALAVDLSSNYLLSGSADSNVLVWSLVELLSFPSSSYSHKETHSPRHVLSAHRSAITSVITGYSASFLNIAVSSSKDKTAILWDYHSGDSLRTFLLSYTPLCLAIDPANRAFYVGFDDGSVQRVDFYPSKITTATSSINEPTSVPISLQSPTRWKISSSDVGETLSLSLSYDSTTLLSGHSSGKILAWDVADGHALPPLADYMGAPITNLISLPPTGIPNQSTARLKIVSIVKPRPHEPFSSPTNQITGSYTFNAQFPTFVPSTDGETMESGIQTALNNPGFPAALLAEGIAQLASWNPNSFSSRPTGAHTAHGEDDYVALDGAADQDFSEEISLLKEQVAYLKRLQHVSNAQIRSLTEERTRTQRQEEKTRERRLRKMKRREVTANEQWMALSVQGKQRNDKEVNRENLVVGEAEEDSLSGTSSSSLESSSGEE